MFGKYGLSESCTILSLMSPRGYKCVLDSRKWLAHAEIVFESSFVGAVCPGEAFSRASSSGFLLCEWDLQRLGQRLVKWLLPLALGTQFCSPKLDGKPHLRVTCFSPGHVENAATSFSRPTWDIVDHIHKDTTAYIDEHNRLWTRPHHDVDLMINEKMATVLQLPCLLE